MKDVVCEGRARERNALTVTSKVTTCRSSSPLLAITKIHAVYVAELRFVGSRSDENLEPRAPLPELQTIIRHFAWRHLIL